MDPATQAALQIPTKPVAAAEASEEPGEVLDPSTDPALTENFGSTRALLEACLSAGDLVAPPPELSMGDRMAKVL